MLESEGSAKFKITFNDCSPNDYLLSNDHFSDYLHFWKCRGKFKSCFGGYVVPEVEMSVRCLLSAAN